ncbi:MAG: hypothetical protein OEZ40_10430 [Candidatus Bathyarchaeota archaeon]|nr:hypothetical protein [Candidatus Bathyarchaeota archaeon]
MQKVPTGIVLGIAVTAIVISVLATSLLSNYQRITNNGNVEAVGVGVYWDNHCTDNVTSIDWGFLEPGAVTNRTVYIKNSGNVPAMLNMTTADWSPNEAYGNITLSWNREGYLLDSGLVVQMVLTLSVSSEIAGVASFSFDIIITGTEL